MKTSKILITGAGGQIGQVLGRTLEQMYGGKNVLSTDLHSSEAFSAFEILDVMKMEEFEALVRKFRPDVVYHLAGILSATGEKFPEKAWNVNTRGWMNALELARKYGISRLFFPSSIAVFGPGSPLKHTKRNVPLHPVTIYGITKVAGENLGQYYGIKYKLDVRSIRYPGIISHQAKPGGGTTDYAVEIFYEALEKAGYDCYIGKDTKLPMMYIDDAIRATVELMETAPENIKNTAAYNVAAVSFTPEELGAVIRKYIPEFTMDFHPDFRDEIARNWPEEVIDEDARADWGWKHQYELQDIVFEMIQQLKLKGISRKGEF